MDKVKNFLKKVFIPKGEILGENIECSIDELEAPIHECGPSHFSHGYSPYIGVPAPVITPVDEWFVAPGVETVKTEKQLTHEEMLEEAVRREEENNQDKEPKDIHQKMYELATQNWTTVGETQGGSENAWQSGTGIGQFR